MENIGTWGGDKAEQKETTEDFFKWIWGKRGGKEEARAVTLALVFTKGSLASPSITESSSQGHCPAQEKRTRENSTAQGQPVLPSKD